MSEDEMSIDFIKEHCETIGDLQSRLKERSSHRGVTILTPSLKVFIDGHEATKYPKPLPHEMEEMSNRRMWRDFGLEEL